MSLTRSSGLWLLCVAHFMTILDLTVVNGALEPIAGDLGASSFQHSLGDRRLRDRLRRVPAGRWENSRHPGPAANIRRGLGRVRTGVACVRRRTGGGTADRRTRPAGPRRRIPRACSRRDPGVSLPGGTGAHASVRDLGIRRQPRRDLGHARRRRGDATARLAGRLPPQRPRRVVRPRPRDPPPPCRFARERHARRPHRRRPAHRGKHRTCTPRRRGPRGGIDDDAHGGRPRGHRHARIRVSPQARAGSTRASWVPAPIGDRATGRDRLGPGGGDVGDAAAAHGDIHERDGTAARSKQVSRCWACG